MNRWRVIVLLMAISFCLGAIAQNSKSQMSKSGAQTAVPDSKAGADFSGMYMFIKEGEFVQVTVEDGGKITGFVSRYGEGESDNGAFLDHFFKSGRLDGNKINFRTESVHGVWFDFKGTVERGDGKNRGDEAYYVLKGTVTQNSTDVNNKVSSHTMDVALKMFPQNASPAPAARN